MKGNAARRKEIYEELHPETRAGDVRAADMNQILERNVAKKHSATFVAATAVWVFPKTFSDGQIGALFIS